MIVKNCKLTLDDGSTVLNDILIVDGKIVKIAKDIAVDGEEVFDAKQNYVLPGIVDLHTHMRDPGLTQKEDGETGSKACAKGGVTTFIDMPNTVPNTITVEELMNKKEIYSKKAYSDFGFYFGGARSDNSLEIEKARDLAAATKTFLNVSTGNMLVEEDGTLENIFRASKIVAVHAEEDMVEKAINIAAKADKPLYLCHISLKEELEYIREAKKKGLKVFGEVTPHHLFLNQDDLNKDDRTKMLLRMKPELKTKEDNDALWIALADGTLDTIGTDHAPHLLSEKLEKVTFGVPSIENSLEIMLNGVLNKKITLKRLIEVMCHNPAKIYKLKNKGFIEEGYDGDLVIVDMEDRTTFNDEEVVSKCGWTPYKGMTRGGKVLTTILRGKIIYNDGKFNEKSGKEVEYYE